MRPFRRKYGLRIYRFPKRFFKRLIFFSLLIALPLSLLFKGGLPKEYFAFASPKNIAIVDITDGDLQEILDSSIPMLAVSQKGPKENITNRIFANTLHTLAGIQLGKPFTFLQAEIPYLKDVNYEIATADEKEDLTTSKPVQSKKIEERENPKKPVEESKPQVTIEVAPLVGIYNTHTGETYEMTDGNVRLKGQRGGVFLVAQEIKRVLEEKHGIGVVQADIIHDYDYRQVLPYGASEKTASTMLAQNPSIEILIDLHRDSVEGMTRQQAVVEINGEKYATMFLVVGSNKRQNHPRWAENHDFAKLVSDKIKVKYPGLLRKQPQVQDGRYNQHLFPRAILVEIGEAKQNSTEESIRTARLFAEVLAEVAKELAKE